ncbi:quercetin 2,3-dioxygenase [Aureococcus anophagefferens]|uniref:Quercetin 2,3-dioxygenase n=1 Tax=Aureococcus anophagefferens TaxID=44056 RepID=A0ABR1G2R8_AURAN
MSSSSSDDDDDEASKPVVVDDPEITKLYGLRASCRTEAREMRLVLALLAGVGALQGAPKALKNPLNEFRKKLAQWSLEDAAMRREVQKEMRREELVGEPDAVDAFRRLQKFYATILDEEEYRAARIVEGGGGIVRPAGAAGVRGPLGDWEQRISELRPEDVVAGARTLVADAAAAARREWSRVETAERSRPHGGRHGRRQRPLDAPPSLLGDIEGFVTALFVEEQARTRDGGAVTTRRARVPAVPGPLASFGAASRPTSIVRNYERRRVEIIREKIPRPKDADPTSVAGVVEAFLNGGRARARSWRPRVVLVTGSSSAALLPVLPNEARRRLRRRRRVRAPRSAARRAAIRERRPS